MNFKDDIFETKVKTYKALRRSKKWNIKKTQHKLW